MPVNRGVLFYSLFQIRLFIYLLFKRFDLLVANDLDTLLPNYLVSVARRIPLIYDSHEYFTGVPELRDRPFVRRIWKSVERFIFPRLRHVMTVSDGIAVLYLKEYGLRPVTVMNCSPSSNHIVPYSREELGIGHDELLVIIQGTGINARRGGEELIEAVAITGGVHLLVVGSGSSVKEMKRLSYSHKASDRIKFVERMTWDQMMRYTRAADAGVTLDRGNDINSLYSLPNKLFDYISAGIAVIAGDIPEVGEIIKTYSCGLIIEDITSGNIASALKTLSEDRKLLETLKRNSESASGILNWKKESEKVSRLYMHVLQENGYF